MTMWTVKPQTGKASCYPEDSKRSVCLTCSRYRQGRPLHTDIRQFVVIDASAMATEAACPMHDARDVARPYCEPAEVAA